jgi:hypothetical protein
LEHDSACTVQSAGTGVREAERDADTAVPVANLRLWHNAMVDLKICHAHVEMGQEDHGSIISKGIGHRRV